MSDKKISGFWSGFTKALVSTISAEIGDKTFFVAAMLSMKHSPFIVFTGAASALLLMTVFSVVIGKFLMSLFEKQITHYICIALFFFFAVKLLFEGITDTGGSLEDEMREVKLEIKQTELKRTSDVLTPSVYHLMDTEKSAAHPGGEENRNELSWSTKITAWVWSHLRSPRSRVFAQAFLLTFLGEWGDRSQITTISLAGAENAYGVGVGSFIGHIGCTGLAVLGGKVLATKISAKHVNIAGGLLLLGFALYGVIVGPDNE
jgi:putative Ca2+/H+ antiporter (TMEM165/GDT1 family)